MLQGEGTAGRKKCAESENTHMKVLQVFSARQILYFLFHRDFVQNLPCWFFGEVVLMFNPQTSLRQEQEQKHTFLHGCC